MAVAVSGAEESRQAAVRRNLMAGTTTAVVLIPQGMAYAMVAGLPPIHGLYASLLPLVAYAIVGRSRELAVGPGALDTLLVGTAIAAMQVGDDASRAAVAATLALMVAGIQAALGLLRAGFLLNFLSRPVISGFTSAAAITIAASQLRHLFGFEMAPAARFVDMLGPIVRGLRELSPLASLVGIVSVLALVGLKRWRPRFPRALVVVGVATAVAAGTGLAGRGLPVVGHIPAGFPAFALPDLSPGFLLELLPTAIAIALVGYLTMISIARTFADRTGTTVSPNRELLAAAAANAAAALSRGFPVSASFSRSAVHAQAGATSPYALLVTAAWVALTLLLLTPLLHHLPNATLAAIIITAVLGLVDMKEIRRLYRVKPADAWLLLLTFVATLTIGVEQGILIGVGASLALLLYRTTRPHAAILGRLPGGTDYRNVRNYREARTLPGVLIVRIDAQFYFGNVTFLRDFLRESERALEQPLSAVIIEACSLNQLDSSADAALHDIAAEYQGRGIPLLFASVKRPVGRVMDASGLTERIGRSHFFMNVHDAVCSLSPDLRTDEAAAD